MAADGPVVFLGAGAVGCFVGGHWTAAGLPVVLLGRAATLAPLVREGLRLSGGKSAQIAAARVLCTDDPSILAGASLIVVSAKATALPGVLADIKTHASPKTPIISLLNGLAPQRLMARALPHTPIISGMVPFNVVWQGPSHLHRSSKGHVALAKMPLTEALAEALAKSGTPIALHADMAPVQHGKLLLNLNNAVNALSGLSLHGELSNRGFRQIYAAALEEALAVYAAAGVDYTNLGAIATARIPAMLRRPNLIFNTFGLRLQRLDKSAMTSTAQDLANGRNTEVDVLNGEIVALAKTAGVSAPINAGLCALIKAAEQGGPRAFTAPELARALGI